MNCYYVGQNYETWLILMANIDRLHGTTEKLRLTVKVCFINDTYHKVLRAILQESEAKLEMKIFNPSSFFVWR